MASVDLLNEEIAALKSHIADEDKERSLAEAKDEAQRWGDMHDEVVSRMTKAAEVQDGEDAAEFRAERKSYELRVLEATVSLEEERMCVRAESIAKMDVLHAEFEKNVEESSKMISALRETRKVDEIRATPGRIKDAAVQRVEDAVEEIRATPSKINDAAVQRVEDTVEEIQVSRRAQAVGGWRERDEMRVFCGAIFFI